MNYTNFDYAFSGLIGGVAVLAIIIAIFVISLIIVSIIATWKMFKKAGRNGWEAVVPFYSHWVLVEIAGLNWWWFLLLILNVAFQFKMENIAFTINIAGFIASFNCYYNIAKKFRKNQTTAILSGLFPWIFVLIFGFSKNETYDNRIFVCKNGIFGHTDMSTDSNSYNDFNDKKNINGSETCETQNNFNEFIFCGNCGTKLNKDTKFCPNCGKEK